MNEKLTHMLNARDKGAGEASGVLAKLFRQILLDRKITPLHWSNLMMRYLDDPRNGVPRDVKDKSSARGNLNKELVRPRMTWKVFRKGLRFLGPRWVRFEVHFGWENGETSIHKLMLDSGPVTEDDELDLGGMYDDTDTPVVVDYLNDTQQG